MNTTQSSVETRLARLETSARRWRVAAIGLAGLVLGGAVLGFGQPDRHFDRDQLDPMDDELLA